MTRIEDITLWRLRVPLIRPYHLTGVVLSDLDVLLAEACDDEGRKGCGEAVIIPHYTTETTEEGWGFCCVRAAELVGEDTATAKLALEPHRLNFPHAVTVMQVAIEMMEGHPALEPPSEPTRVPLLMAVMSQDPGDIPSEVESHLKNGFKTLKLKGGWDIEADLKRLAAVQRAAAGAAAIRFDANQGYTKEAAMELMRRIVPDGIESIEQPCAANDWEANTAAAAAAPVPLKLDESVYELADIDRAAKVDGCGYVKMMLVKRNGLTRLQEAMERIRAVGLSSVLGNGASTDVNCWAEACVARHTINNAGEMNGFLKNREQLWREPLKFEDGAIVLEPGFRPTLNHEMVDRLSVTKEHFASSAGDS
ncbi:MAG: mandelate racemase [Alphaproteobacteria bacterium]|nr:mandelate racemase [Alphaproteobacteria bacterium]